MFEWLFGEKVIKKGTISKMWHEAAAPAPLLTLIPVPIYGDPVAARWMVEFKHDDKFRIVEVSQECYQRYKVGECIAFDN